MAQLYAKPFISQYTKSRNNVVQYDNIGLNNDQKIFFIAAKSALEKLISPVIIDNTNTQCWEMKPYVSMVRVDITDRIKLMILCMVLCG